MFWNILPENVKGIVAVVETSTGQITSFQVDGKFVSIESACVLAKFCSLCGGLSHSLFLSNKTIKGSFSR